MSQSNNGLDNPNASASRKQTDVLRLDFTTDAGRVKALHGINNSPVTHGRALPELREAGIPYVRLHDAAGPFGGTYFVDVPNIFPDFEADPDDPESYDFAFTDAYLNGLKASGVEIFYRLGTTIENHWRIKAHRIHPPRDFHKWARICAGIVRHYNEGWAGGFHHGIEYWEIWNEPENPPMWTGTREEYFELYRVAANHLKKEFPSLKIGGYGSCGFYALSRADADDFQRSFLSYYEAFLKYITTAETAAPLDFFSWHLYTTDPGEIIVHAEYVERKLGEHGLEKTENIFNEWNAIDWKETQPFDAIKEMPGATFTAAAFCLMQDSPIDKAMYYDALPTREYCGLYYFPSGKVTRTYYAFRAFNELYALGTAVECSHQRGGGIYACAAKNGAGQAAALIVNREERERSVRLETPGAGNHVTCLVLDGARVLTETNHLLEGGELTLPRQSVVLLRFE